MNILFDLDGTLVDPRRGIISSVQYALDRLGASVPPADELLWVIGPSLRASFAKLLDGSEHTEEALALYRESYRAGAMYDAVVYAGIVDALEALAASGRRLFVATAKPHYYARPILEHFGLERHFAGIYGPELDGTNDSKADLIAYITAKERLDPARTIMIGDRGLDVSAAARNGIRTVGVTWGYGSVEELTAAGAAALCHSPAMLPQAATGLLAWCSEPSR